MKVVSVSHGLYSELRDTTLEKLSAHFVWRCERVLTTWRMVDAKVVDMRMVYTHHIPGPNPGQESNGAGQYEASG